MFLTTKLLNLIGILAIASSSVEVVPESDELDDSLKQALFLVELLKLDFAQVLRSNAKADVNTNATSYEDVNSTCPLPLEDFNNSTINETEVTGSVVSTDVDSTPTAHSTPPTPSNLVTPAAAPMMPFSSWPPMPIPGYAMPPRTGHQGNFLDENYRFPYRFNRRHMVPDYYNIDSPGKSNGKFRRLDSNYTNDQTGDLGNATAILQLQITTNIPSTRSKAPTLHVEETKTTTISQTIRQSTLPTIEPSTIPRNRVRTRVPVSKAMAAIISYRNDNHLSNVSNRHQLRHKKTTTEKYTTDVEMSQVVSELEKELEGSKTENISNISSQCKKDRRKMQHSTTIKIYLKGSSRLPIPLPENNAFCHHHPNNGLCGTNL